MNNNYMAACADEFLEKIEAIELNERTFEEINLRRNRIVDDNGILANFIAKSNELKTRYAPNNVNANNVEKQLSIVLNSIDKNIAKWKQQVELYAKGVRFIEKHQKYFVVMIFGPVKAGKSTLGNFFGGKSYRNAAFDNKYKMYPQPQKYNEEEARKENNGENYNTEDIFRVGILDTTGNMQYFTMFKLCWMDTPGLGALGKEGDKRKMDEMVDEYICYADMCIFVINSSEPGLAKELQYMSKLTDEERDALVIITKSDTLCKDKNSRYYKKKISKTDEDRKLQEQSLKSRLKEAYPDVDADKYSIISISTEVAENAIATDDEELFRCSNLDKLMAELGKACIKAAEKKGRLPKQTFNNFIDDIISGTDITVASNDETVLKGIAKIKNEIEKINLTAQDYKKQILQKENNLLLSMQMKIKSEINKKLEEFADEVRKCKKKIGQEEISEEINKIINSNLNIAINKAMADIISNYKKQPISIKNVNFETGSLENKTDVITAKYTVTELRARSPQGAWEHIRGYFGKQYYRSITREKEVFQEIDLGPNINEISDKVIEGVGKELKKIIHTELSRLRNSYFVPQEAYAKEMINLLNTLEKDLQSLKI